MSVYDEINAERGRQDRKWGEQNHPNVDPVLAARPATAQRIAEEHEIPTADRAKFLCRTAALRHQCSWTAIAVEELCEAVEVHDNPERLREELIQLAAVIVQWIQAIDRNKE